MYIADKNQMLVGIDHGFSIMKSTHSIFPNGIKKLGSAATLSSNTLVYKDQTYKIGEGRLPMKEDKVSDDDYYILTLAAIAKEMQFYGITMADVTIAAGLPFSRFGQEKQGFEAYLGRQRYGDFTFDGKDYFIQIDGVHIFPQCYAAIASQLGQLGAESLAVDIGSKTIDILHIVNNVPVESESTSLLGALIGCMEGIKNEVYRMANRRVTETQIQMVMETGTAEINEKCLEIIRTQLRLFAEQVEAKLNELGFDLEMMPVTYVGGGAGVMRQYGSYHRRNIRFVEDVRANAIGYEYLCRNKLGL